MFRFFGGSMDRSVWLTLILLAFAVVFPSTCLIWLIDRAAGNEQMALKQALTESRIREGELIRNQLINLSREWTVNLSAELERMQPSEWCHRLAAGDPGILYRPDRASATTAPGDLWAVEDLMSEIRFLAHSMGEVAAVNRIHTEVETNPQQHRVLFGGYSLKSYLLLMAVRMSENAGLDTRVFGERLLREVARTGMPESQRRFLLYTLKEQGMNTAEVDRLCFEAELVNLWRHRDGAHENPVPEEQFQSSGNLIFYVCAGGKTVFLVDRDRFQERIFEGISSGLQDPQEGIRLLVPGESVHAQREVLRVMDLEGSLKGWRLLIREPKHDPATVGVDRRIFFYVWTGLVAIALSILLVLISLGLIRRQIGRSQLKNDLVATVSHELKTPISSVRLLVETMLDEPGKPEASREYLEIIHRENHRLGQLVEKFLTFSRMERDAGFFEFSAQSPISIAEEAERIFRERFGEMDYELETRFDPEMPDIRADREALVSALGNLLENAYKYSGKKKWICLRCVKGKKQGIFEVEDRGRGISGRERKKIFDRFYQPDRRLNQHRGGVGLGLSIVGLVVKKHRGKIELESEPEKGSVFRIRIPNA